MKEYSTGMYVRLAFSTAIHVDPEILVVDEALAVGDAIFASRCIQKFEELRQRKVTVLLVSHDLGLVKRLADRAAFMLRASRNARLAQGCREPYVGFVLDQERGDKTNDKCHARDRSQKQLPPRRRRKPHRGCADARH